jgi:hypothetical protein
MREMSRTSGNVEARDRILDLSTERKLKHKNTIILLMVLYGCETWSLTLRVEHRLKVFENRLMRKIF